MDPKQRNYLLLALCAILVIGSWVLFVPPNKKITQGLDIQGGLSVILTAKPAEGKSLTTTDMDRAELIVRNRVDKLGASETSIQRQGSDSILVQIPGIKNAEEALKVIGSTGQLEFVEVASITDTATVAALRTGEDNVKLKAGTYKPFMTGEVVKTAAVSQNTQHGPDRSQHHDEPRRLQDLGRGDYSHGADLQGRQVAHRRAGGDRA